MNAHCYVCKRWGHTKKDCPHKRCYHCGKEGHTTADCPKLDAKIADQFAEVSLSPPRLGSRRVGVKQRGGEKVVLAWASGSHTICANPTRGVCRHCMRRCTTLTVGGAPSPLHPPATHLSTLFASGIHILHFI